MLAVVWSYDKITMQQPMNNFDSINYLNYCQLIFYYNKQLLSLLGGTDITQWERVQFPFKLNHPDSNSINRELICNFLNFM